MNTGWIRYWICDRSGSGREKWNYLYWPDIQEIEDAKYEILRIREDWAQWAESYSMEIELNVVPTKDAIAAEAASLKDLLAGAKARLRRFKQAHNEY